MCATHGSLRISCKMLRASACVVASLLLGTGAARSPSPIEFRPAPSASATASGQRLPPDSQQRSCSRPRRRHGPADACRPRTTAVAEKLRELVENELHRHVPREQDRAGVQAFYRDRGFAPLWTVEGRTAAGGQATPSRSCKALPPTASTRPTIRRRDFADASPDRLAADELKLTNSVLAFARHASIGRVAFTRMSGVGLLRPEILRRGHAAQARRIRRTSARRCSRCCRSIRRYKALKAALANASATSGDAKRADLIVANMERWRWLPRDLGTTYVMVNVPDFTLKVVNRGETVWTTRIVAGKPGNLETPLLTETMKFITVNPTWNVPPSIIRNEYLPALARDPGALARLGLKVGHNRDGSIRIYQPPGAAQRARPHPLQLPEQVPGLPARHAAKAPVRKAARAPSAMAACGCRIRSSTRRCCCRSRSRRRATPRRASATCTATTSAPSTSRRPIPVYITYQTAFVDDAGKLQTRADVYGHDKAITRLLQGRARRSPTSRSSATTRPAASR